jgi:hypothetical protein
MQNRIEGQDRYAEKAAGSMPSTRRRKPADPMPPNLETTIQEIMALHRRHRAIIKAQQRIDRSCEAYLASLAGYAPTLPQPERLKIWKEVGRVRRLVESNMKAAEQSAAHAGHRAAAEMAVDTLPASRKGNRDDGPTMAAEKASSELPSSLPSWADIPTIEASAIGRRTWDILEPPILKRLETLAATLPGFAFWNGFKGLGPAGLAHLIGETGDLNAFADKSKLWKFMGIAVIEGKRQQKRKSKEEAKLHAYNPERRSLVWQIMDSCMKHQRPKEQPPGPYGALYNRRREATAHRPDWSKQRQHDDACRYASKKLLSHLLAAWKQATKPEEPNA